MAATIPFVLGLTACGQERVRLAPVPVELTTCAAEPAAPDLPGLDGTPETQRARDGMVLDYILRLRSAWGSCAAVVAGVKAWNEGLN